MAANCLTDPYQTSSDVNLNPACQNDSLLTQAVRCPWDFGQRKAFIFHFFLDYIATEISVSLPPVKVGSENPNNGKYVTYMSQN